MISASKGSGNIYYLFKKFIHLINSLFFENFYLKRFETLSFRECMFLKFKNLQNIFKNFILF